MNARLQHFLEAHPWSGGIIALFTWFVDWLLWLVHHSDDFTRVFTLASAILAFAIAYYTLRIKRREWRRGQPTAATPNPPRPDPL